MRSLTIGALLLLMVFTVAALAADVAGAWRVSYTTDDGETHESTLSLKVDGDKVSGRIASPHGSVPIADGKVSGNDISFIVLQRGHGEDITISYTGKVEGDTMKLTMRIGVRDPIEVTVKRVPQQP